MAGLGCLLEQEAELRRGKGGHGGQPFAGGGGPGLGCIGGQAEVAQQSCFHRAGTGHIGHRLQGRTLQPAHQRHQGHEIKHRGRGAQAGFRPGVFGPPTQVRGPAGQCRHQRAKPGKAMFGAHRLAPGAEQQHLDRITGRAGQPGGAGRFHALAQRRIVAQRLEQAGIEPARTAGHRQRRRAIEKRPEPARQHRHRRRKRAAHRRRMLGIERDQAGDQQVIGVEFGHERVERGFQPAERLDHRLAQGNIVDPPFGEQTAPFGQR
jgi:hypothetical protein